MKDAYQQAAKAYQNTDLAARVQAASPHELINLLLEGAKKNINIAKICMENKEIELKTVHIGKAMDIIMHLKECLNKEQGGDIAQNLDRLYDYANRNMFIANLQNDPSKLDDILKVLEEIHEGWQAIKQETEDSQP